MGREVRRVPPNWQHPVWTEADCSYPNKLGQLRPCYDKDYESAASEWIAELHQWEAGTHPEQPCSYARYYWEYANTPDEDTCRPKFTEEPTWFQLYETVSEGTPVTPPFATQEELAQYLATEGDFWYQQDMKDHRLRSFRTKPTIDQARALVSSGAACSMVIEVKDGKVDIQQPHEQFDV